MMQPTISSSGLHCGFDRSANLKLSYNGPFIMVECLSHSKIGNQICSLSELNIIFTDRIVGRVTREQEIVIAKTICDQLSTFELVLKYNPQHKEFYL